MASLRDLIDKQKQLKAQKEAEKSPLPNGEYKGVIVQIPQTPPTEATPLRQSIRRFGKKGGESKNAPAVGTVNLVEKKPQTSSMPYTRESQQSAVSSSPERMFETPLQEAVKAAKVDLPHNTVEDLRQNLAFLAANIENKDLVKQAVRTVAGMLAANPQFSTQMPMQRSDFNLLVKGVRRSYEMAARKKAQRQETRQKSEADQDEVMRLLKDLDI